MKTLLIITGPQGSGNHLWSKILASTPGVFGWQALTKEYWIAHDQEPFAEAWKNPELLKDIEFDKFAFTSISCPYIYHSEVTVPRYVDFFNEAQKLGYTLKLGLIGRDRNVVEHQQVRIRGKVTLPEFEKRLDIFQAHNPVFLSTELLYLYRRHYIKSVSKQLGFPIHVNSATLDEILIKDPNSKYFVPTGPQELDQVMWTQSRAWAK